VDVVEVHHTFGRKLLMDRTVNAGSFAVDRPAVSTFAKNSNRPAHLRGRFLDNG
jgi:hypothetical protein